MGKKYNITGRLGPEYKTFEELEASTKEYEYRELLEAIIIKIKFQKTSTAEERQTIITAAENLRGLISATKRAKEKSELINRRKWEKYGKGEYEEWEYMPLNLLDLEIIEMILYVSQNEDKMKTLEEYFRARLSLKFNGDRDSRDANNNDRPYSKEALDKMVRQAKHIIDGTKGEGKTENERFNKAKNSVLKIVNTTANKVKRKEVVSVEEIREYIGKYLRMQKTHKEVDIKNVIASISGPAKAIERQLKEKGLEQSGIEEQIKNITIFIIETKRLYGRANSPELKNYIPIANDIIQRLERYLLKAVKSEDGIKQIQELENDIEKVLGTKLRIYPRVSTKLTGQRELDIREKRTEEGLPPPYTIEEELRKQGIRTRRVFGTPTQKGIVDGQLGWTTEMLYERE